MKHVLFVTGATGVIGRPLVEALCADPDVDRVYALAHRTPVDVADERLTSIAGDVTAGPDLDLDAAVAREIVAEITGFIHLAADTRFGAAIDSARRTNVQGTNNVLGLAERCPKLDRLMCLSTVHVAGKRTGRINEDALTHASGFVNSYEASKYEMEQELRRRMVDLPISVCRLSTVIGDSRTGEISKLGAIHQALRFMYAGLAPMVPGKEDSPVDLIALDYAIGGIVNLTLREFVPGRTWHLCAGHDTLTLGEMLDLTMQTFIDCRPGWRRRSIGRPVLADLATFELFRRSLDEVGDSALRTSLGVVAHFAPQLAFPKQFDDSRCRAALQNHMPARPHARECLPCVVRHLIETKWAPQGQQAAAVEP